MNIAKSLKVGIGFGLSSAAITTLGLIVGLDASTGSRLAVIGGVLTIAVADAFSDALGVHVAKELEGNFSDLEIWQATISTLLLKFVFACTFLIPIILLPMNLAIIAALIWGAIILVAVSYFSAKDKNQKPGAIIFEHLSIAVVVIVITYFLGQFIAKVFI